jgi:hypothetical protein
MRKGYFSFNRLFWSYTFCFIPVAMLAGLLALFHVIPVYFNESPVYGIKGFVIAVLFIPFFGLLFSSMNWIVLNFGYFLYNMFLKIVRKEGANRK